MWLDSSRPPSEIKVVVERFLLQRSKICSPLQRLNVGIDAHVAQPLLEHSRDLLTRLIGIWPKENLQLDRFAIDLAHTVRTYLPASGIKFGTRFHRIVVPFWYVRIVNPARGGKNAGVWLRQVVLNLRRDRHPVNRFGKCVPHGHVLQ